MLETTASADKTEVLPSKRERKDESNIQAETYVHLTGNKPQLYFECPLHQQLGTLGEEYSPVTRVLLAVDLERKQVI